MSADVWTQGSSIAAKNSAKLVEINSDSTPPCDSQREPRCGVCWGGEQWQPTKRWRAGANLDGPNARTEGGGE